jgi:hypothetical protein
MSLFNQLPEDLQRFTGGFLTQTDIKKLAPCVLSNPNDIFWRERMKQYIPNLPTVNYQTLCERFYYQSLIGKKFERKLAEQLIDDDTFLENHVDLRDLSGFSLLMFFCYDGMNNEKEILKLLSHGANVRLISFLSETTALHGAVSKQSSKVVEELLKAGAHVNHQTGGRNRWSPLMEASLDDRVENARVLLRYGANAHLKGPEDIDGTQATALSLAQSDEMKKLLST